jgi:DNA-directed RNA polymerase subunit RPC12/RpoP
MQNSLNVSDYFRVKRAKEKESAVHKIVCKKCGWYNDPTRLHKRENEKYYRCIKCGSELKSDKDNFKDTLNKLLKGGLS